MNRTRTHSAQAYGLAMAALPTFAAIADAPDAPTPAVPDAPDAPTPAVPDAPAGSLANRALLIDFTKKAWSARKLDKKATAQVAAANNVAQESGHYLKKLGRGEAALEQLIAIGNEAYAEHLARTLAWDKAYRIIDAAAYAEYVSVMRAFQQRYEPLKAVFVAEYPAIVERDRARLDGLFNPADYPSPREIADRFDISYFVTNVPVAGDVRCNVPPGELARIQQAMTEAAEARLAATRDELVERIRKAVGHVAERLRAYKVTPKGSEGVFRDSLLDGVKELAHLVPSLNFTGDPAIAEIGAALKADLCAFAPETLRESPVVRNDTAAKAEAILGKLNEYFA